MTKTVTPPSELQLLDLAYSANFPVNREQIVKIARNRHFSPATVQFLNHFGAHDQFENGVDFVNRCEEVKLLEQELTDAPREQLRSPQG